MNWTDATQNPLGLQDSEEFDAINRQRYEYCLKIARLFGSDTGKEILELWRQNTVGSAAWMPSLAQQVGLDAANAHAYAREGQNAFFRDIEESMDAAHKYKTFEDFCKRTNLS